MSFLRPASPNPSSEDEILQCISSFFPNKHPSIDFGRGDDCALFHVGHSMAVSTDLFLENVHFRRAYFTPEDVGYKALAVNLSDLAACGARPVGFTLCLGLPHDLGMDWLKHFFSGMAKLAEKYNMILMGGDLSRSSSVHISITAFGEISGVSCFLTRGGSMPGDKIFLVGQIGLAHVGLNVLEQLGRSAFESYPIACQAHLHPLPHCEAGQVLARAAYHVRPPALMDVSDGLIRDLPRLLGLKGELGTSQAEGICPGARLNLPPHIIHPEVLQWSHEQHLDPLQTLLLGGEDYALLGTCAPDLLPTLEAAIPEFICIGTITKEEKIICNGQEITSFEGFDHFANQN
ncbi:MAG: thiamine-phosphate kinase [Desulfovibrio sp.]|nr:thiamine-phosphate kinase [Desulfovibrio sp.]